MLETTACTFAVLHCGMECMGLYYFESEVPGFLTFGECFSGLVVLACNSVGQQPKCLLEEGDRMHKYGLESQQRGKGLKGHGGD